VKTLAVIPTYCESENIGAMLSFIIDKIPSVHVLVVDDNSPDGTGKMVENFRQNHPRVVHLLSREKKEGLGPAYVAGFNWGLARDYDSFVQLDADFSHDPLDIPRLVGALDSFDAAFGCRYVKGGGIHGWSLLRHFISRGGNWYAGTMLKMPQVDLTGGFNAWRRNVLEKILSRPIRSRGYSFQVELKFRAFQEGFGLAEIPIQFEDRVRGSSKMSLRIAVEAALRIWQLRRQG
jgi:dolichol-phosphate mannosyltransferase